MRHPAADTDFTGKRPAGAEDSLEQFGAAGPDQPRQYHDFATVHDQRDVCEFVATAEMAQFEQRLAERAGVRRAVPRPAIATGDQRHDVLTIEPIDRIGADRTAVPQHSHPVDQRRDFLEPVADIDDADSRLRQFPDENEYFSASPRLSAAVGSSRISSFASS